MANLRLDIGRRPGAHSARTATTELGGQHHGYLLPSEGANNIAYAFFTFPSLAAYEDYRAKSFKDPDCQKAFKYAQETGCILSYERGFLRPVFEGA